jgi:hypothetical protein
LKYLRADGRITLKWILRYMVGVDWNHLFKGRDHPAAQRNKWTSRSSSLTMYPKADTL